MIDPIADLYLICPAIGWGPWILDLATSNGMLMQDANVPDTNPIPTFLKNSDVGSCKKSAFYKSPMK